MSGPTIICPRCRHSNPPAAVKCAGCGSAFPDSDAAVTQGIAEGWSMVPSASLADDIRVLAPGTLLGGRYEILKLLGEGGMGAVYQARDRELDRIVGLKVIRPELAGNPKILQRFKQELIVARQVTHKNVIRIFDLGMADGVRFITMEFIEGRDLSAVLEEGRLPVDEAVRIVRQVAHALDAAHTESVIHRDLKPQNIMLDNRGKVVVMDFGLARSMEMVGMTQTGVLLGTPAYMSPEQAAGAAVDARSDLFALGIISYEMLTGQVPFQADTILASLLKRTQETPPAPSSLRPEVPAAIGDVVLKCLATKMDQRYQSAAELLAALDAATGVTTAAAASTPALPVPAPPRGRTHVWQGIAAGLGLLLAGALWFGLARGWLARKPAAPPRVLGVLVADFENRTGEPIFDHTLEPMFSVALEGASFLTVMPRDQALRIAEQLRPGIARLDQATARLVATREGIPVVVGGSIARRGGDYEVSVSAVTPATGKTIAQRQTGASSKDKVLATVGKLAAPIRNALGDATPESAQVGAAETFSSSSLEAAHDYALAQQLRYQGKGDEAIAQYRQALQLDPNFGSAYASMAAVYANLGQQQQAAQYYQMAMAHLDRMSDRERYRTRGSYYLLVRDSQKAIEEFSALVRRYPGDTLGHSYLAFAYYLKRDLPRAMQEARMVVDVYPKNVPYRNNMALYTLYAGEFATAAREAQAGLAINATYVKGYVTLALAQLAQGQADQAAATYQRLAAIGARGASFAAMGQADLALYQGRLADAVASLEPAAAADLAGGNPGGAAKKRAALAEAQLALGHTAAAVAAAAQAVDGGKTESVYVPAALVYIGAGQDAKAAALARALGQRLESLPQAYAQLIDGAIHLAHDRGRDAITRLQEAQKLEDTWLGRLYLARAYLAAGALTEADSELERCVERRGEAVDVFSDDVQTIHYLPPVFYYMGRLREALRSPNAADAFRNFLALKDPRATEPLVLDARRRIQ